MCFIVGLVLTSTIYDVWTKQYLADAQHGRDSSLMKAIHCFSAKRNVREFLKDSGSEEIGCVNGIRALTTLVTVNYHLALIGLAGVINQGAVYKVNQSTWIQPLLIGKYYSNKIGNMNVSYSWYPHYSIS